MVRIVLHIASNYSTLYTEYSIAYERRERCKTLLGHHTAKWSGVVANELSSRLRTISGAMRLRICPHKVQYVYKVYSYTSI